MTYIRITILCNYLELNCAKTAKQGSPIGSLCLEAADLSSEEKMLSDKIHRVTSLSIRFELEIVRRQAEVT